MAPLEITLTLDIDQHLARHVGYDEDGESVQQPTTIEDVVIGMAARQFVAGLDTDTRQRVNERVRAITDETIREQIAPLITAAIVRSVQPTDRLGNPKGDAKTMAEVIIDAAEKTLRKSSDAYSRKGSLVDEFIKAEVGATFQRELKAAADAAKAEVVAAIKEKGSEVLAQTITAMAGVK